MNIYQVSLYTGIGMVVYDSYGLTVCGVSLIVTGLVMGVIYSILKGK